MSNCISSIRSAKELTNFLHTLGIAAPIFLILVGCYLIYRDVLHESFMRTLVLILILVVVALLSPLGSRLRNLEFNENGCEIQPFHTTAYQIAFEDIDRFSIDPLFGIVKLKLGATEGLPSDSLWFIPDRPAGLSRREYQMEISAYLNRRLSRATVRS